MLQKNLVETHVEELKKLIHDKYYKLKNITNKSAFSREGGGKLGFVRTLMIMLNFMKKTSQKEINEFFKHVIDSFEYARRQSFDEARRKIKFEAFQEIFEKSASHALMPEDSKLLKGYRVFAIDGSTLKLFSSPELKLYFGKSTPDPKKEQVFARTSIVFDVLNGFIFDALIEPYSVGERQLAAQHTKKINSLESKNNLSIFDRGYWNSAMAAEIQASCNKFLFRVQKNAITTISKSTQNSGFVEIKTKESVNKYRFYKFYLESGELEILVTNLDGKLFPDEELSALYFLRWGVETKFAELKQRLDIENFTGKSTLIVKQDFYATVYLSNLMSFFKYASDAEIEESYAEKDLKYPKKTNTSMVISHLKDDFVKAVITQNPLKSAFLIDHIKREIAKDSIPIRKGRHSKRPDAHPEKSHNSSKMY